MVAVSTQVKNKLNAEEKRKAAEKRATLKREAAYETRQLNEFLKTNNKSVISKYLKDHPADVISFPISYYGGEKDWPEKAFLKVKSWFKNDGFTKIEYDYNVHDPYGSDPYSYDT
jgi:phenylalanyl-tRNA synthetase alpha subunit